MEDRAQTRKHLINMSDRKSAVLTGVNDVRSFDEQEIILETEQGMLMIRGSELHIGRLTLEKGEVDITGNIDSLVYSEIRNYKKTGESLLKRMFK
ncbi:MAG: sporulation protein YabP [Lachnospiraceae bacterium]|nr:sporulation protein YabP [Lachnospiraceae bacterium]